MTQKNPDALNTTQTASFIGMGVDKFKRELPDLVKLRGFPKPYIGTIDTGGRHRLWWRPALRDWLSGQTTPHSPPAIKAQQRKLADRLAARRDARKS